MFGIELFSSQLLKGHYFKNSMYVYEQLDRRPKIMVQEGAFDDKKRGQKSGASVPLRKKCRNLLGQTDEVYASFLRIKTDPPPA
jgi:hypothetical protein